MGFILEKIQPQVLVLLVAMWVVLSTQLKNIKLRIKGLEDCSGLKTIDDIDNNAAILAAVEAVITRVLGEKHADQNN